MGQEIERKFLVVGDGWRSLGTGKFYSQGYIPTENHTTVRVRVAGDQGYLTIKGKTQGIRRQEFEYAIPRDQAQEMLETLCDRPLITKIRYTIPHGDHLWEVDEFQGENQGLIVAEVELRDPEETFECPPWLGEEVSHDPRYYNLSLSQYPFSQWATVDPQKP